MAKREHRETVDFAHIRRVVPITAILSRYGLLEKLKKAGSQLKGCCPIHDGTSKSAFVVNPATNTYFCFADCNAGGGILELVSALERIDIKESAQLVAEWFSIPAVSQTRQQKQHRRKQMSGSPSFKVYSVADREWKDPKTGELKKSWWTRIGTAFENKDGSHSIQLDALPVPTMYEGAVQTRIALRPYDAEDEPAPEPAKKSSSRK